MGILDRLLTGKPGTRRHQTTEQKRWDDLKDIMKLQNPGLMFIPGRSIVLQAAFRRFKKAYEGGK